MRDEVGLEVVRDNGAGALGVVALRPWVRRNLDAAFVDLAGGESPLGVVVAEVRPGESSAAAHQLFEETLYVLRGHGSTTIESADGTIHFEWTAGSVFTIPLNASYRLHNGSGVTAARLVSVNALPLAYGLYRDAAFVFDNAHDFGRIGSDGDALVAYDVRALARSDAAARGADTTGAAIERGESGLASNVRVLTGRAVAPGRPQAAVVLALEGSGHSMLGPDAWTMERYDWPAGDIGALAVPAAWRCEHVVESPAAVLLTVTLNV